MKKTSLLFFITVLYLTGGISLLQAQVTDTTAQWAWIHGDTVTNLLGVYGTKGIASDTTRPGARNGTISWQDKSGNVWLYGGAGYITGYTTATQYLNEFWKYNPVSNQWAWVGGSQTRVLSGVYGQKGVAAATNYPPPRTSAVKWTDTAGNFWMFGGLGYGGVGSTAIDYGDLWKFDPVNELWTWVDGDTAGVTTGVYHGPSMRPGGRNAPATWVDKENNLWLFGGTGYAKATTRAVLNDLWMYNIATNTWTFQGGDSVVRAAGRYGAAPQWPGARTGVILWQDDQGIVWLFGGSGHTTSSVTSTAGPLNDFWKFDPATKTMTFIGGSTTPGAATSYGIKGDTALSNNPGARFSAASWVDANGKFWLYSGARTGTDRYTDMWRYDPDIDRWAWLEGFNSNEMNGVYGARAVQSDDVYPGSRYPGSWWTDRDGNFWLFGGYGYGATGRTATTSVNDLWKFAPQQPVNPCPLPPAVIAYSGSTHICPGDSLILKAPVMAGLHYQWKRGSANVGTDDSVLVVKDAGDYSVDIYTSPVCQASAPQVSVTKSGLSAATTPSAGTIGICSGDSVVLRAQRGVATSWQWRSGAASVGTDSNYTVKTMGNYTVTLTEGACTLVSDTIRVNVASLPGSVTVPAGAQSICSGDSLAVSVNTPGSSPKYYYVWRNGTTQVQGDGRENKFHQSGNYTVEVTDSATGCISISQPVVLTVHSLPPAVINTSGPLDFCAGGNVLLNAGSLSGHTYEWRKDGVVSGGQATYTADQTGAYTVRVTDGNNCTDSSAAVSVLVHDQPSFVLIPGDTAFCDGGKARLEVITTDTGLSFEWYRDGIMISNASASFYEVFEADRYEVVVGRTHIASCADTAGAEIFVHDLPMPSVHWDGSELSTDSGYVAYQWYRNQQKIDDAVSMIYRPLLDGVYTVSVTDSNGCMGVSDHQEAKHVSVGMDARPAFRIYPNPVVDYLNIAVQTPVSVRIIAMDGRVVYTGAEVMGRIDMRGMTNGVYFLQVTDESGRYLLFRDKFIKQ